MKKALNFLCLFLLMNCSNTFVLKTFPESNAYLLPKSLKEVSGLSLLTDSTLAMIQDEKGEIFIYDLLKETIVNKIKFTKKGDFEGISYYKNKFYVLRSDGVIYKIKKDGSNKKFEPKNHDHIEFEGVCLDQENSRLLLAVKNSRKKKNRNHFLIYSFDLKKESFSKHPVIDFDYSPHFSRNIKPSGIAIHPQTKNIFILASVGKKIIELSQDHQFVNSWGLNSSQFPQPEGITFDSNSNLYITNEGIGQNTAKLLQFHNSIFTK